MGDVSRVAYQNRGWFPSSVAELGDDAARFNAAAPSSGTGKSGKCPCGRGYITHMVVEWFDRWSLSLLKCSPTIA